MSLIATAETASRHLLQRHRLSQRMAHGQRAWRARPLGWLVSESRTSLRPSRDCPAWRVVSEELPGAEMVHTYVATMQLDSGAQQRHCLLASSQSPLGATRFCLAGSQAAAVPICRD
jgi:hypothetical protein